MQDTVITRLKTPVEKNAGEFTMTGDSYLTVSKKHGKGTQQEGEPSKRISHNRKYNSTDGSEIACRHLAFFVFLQDYLSSENVHKLQQENLELMLTDNAYFTGNQYDNQYTNQTYDHQIAIDNNEIGNYLSNIAKELTLNPPGNSVSILFNSEHHAMCFYIFKEKNGTIHIKLYDPNDTYYYKVVSFGNAEDVKTFSLVSLLGTGDYSYYFPTFKSCFLQFNNPKEIKFNIHAEKKLTSMNDQFYYYCKYGVTEKVAAILEDIAQQDASEQCSLLSSKDTKEASGLYHAITSGHIGVVRTVLESLPSLKINEALKDIIINEATSRLFPDIANGHIGVVKTVLAALPSLKLNTNQKDIIVEKAGSGLFLAIRNGYIDMVKTVLEALPSSGLDEHHKDIIVKKAAPGLLLAIRDGHIGIGMVKTLLEALPSSGLDEDHKETIRGCLVKFGVNNFLTEVLKNTTAGPKYNALSNLKGQNEECSTIGNEKKVFL